MVQNRSTVLNKLQKLTDVGTSARSKSTAFLALFFLNYLYGLFELPLHPGLPQAPKMVNFAARVSDLKLWIILGKCSILDLCRSPWYACATIKNSLTKCESSKNVSRFEVE